MYKIINNVINVRRSNKNISIIFIFLIAFASIALKKLIVLNSYSFTRFLFHKWIMVGTAIKGKSHKNNGDKNVKVILFQLYKLQTQSKG